MANFGQRRQRKGERKKREKVRKRKRQTECACLREGNKRTESYR